MGTSERSSCVGEFVTECTSQRSPSTLSETFLEPLSECQFPLRVAVLLPLIVLPLKTLAVRGLSELPGKPGSFGHRGRNDTAANANANSDGDPKIC